MIFKIILYTRDNIFYLDHSKKAKSLSLAPLEVEIHITRGSSYMDCNGKRDDISQNTKSFCSKIN